MAYKKAASGFDYDIALSCSEKDLGIAQQLVQSFRERKISYYLYSEDLAYSFGRDLFDLTIQKYHAHAAKYMLMLISKSYTGKYWSDIEWRIAKTIKRNDEPYFLPLYLEDDIVSPDGLSQDIVFLKWNNNPDEIANIIYRKIYPEQDIPLSGEKKARTIPPVKKPVSLGTLIPEMKRLYSGGYPEQVIIEIAYTRYPLSKEYLAGALREIIKEIRK